MAIIRLAVKMGMEKIECLGLRTGRTHCIEFLRESREKNGSLFLASNAKRERKETIKDML